MNNLELWDYASEKLPVVKKWGWDAFSKWFFYMKEKGFAEIFMEKGCITGIGVARPLATQDQIEDRYAFDESGHIAYVDCFTCDSKNKDVFLKRLILATGLRKKIGFKRLSKQKFVSYDMVKFMERLKNYGHINSGTTGSA